MEFAGYYHLRVSRPTAIDLFAGAGGATQGLKEAGFNVVGAVEMDHDASATYALNHPEVVLWREDIRSVPAARMRRDLKMVVGQLTLLKACPPCQGFSTLAEGRASIDDDRNDLVGHTVRYVRAFRPRAVLLENVPGLERNRRFPALVAALEQMGYTCVPRLVNAADFEVPQRRRRLIVLCVRSTRAAVARDVKASLDAQTSIYKATVRDAFDGLSLTARSEDPLDRHRTSSPTVLARLKAIPAGGGRFDLPVKHQLDCHKRLGTRRNATSSYGRLRYDSLAPTMTTRCTTPACGSFVHPTEARGISLREAASLQTFPATYDFAGSYGSIERQIGNAVPVRMARALGLAVLKALPEPTKVNVVPSAAELASKEPPGEGR